MTAERVRPGSARERILVAAEHVAGELSAVSFTLDVVAQTAGVSKGGLLYHFPSKESLLGALAHRYIERLDRYIDEAKATLSEAETGRDLKACVLGLLGTEPRSHALAALAFATVMNEPSLLKIIGDGLIQYRTEAADAPVDFSRANILLLAIDGLMYREALRISSFTVTQRQQIVGVLLQIAEEASR